MTIDNTTKEEVSPDEFYAGCYFDEPESGVEAEELLCAARLALICDMPFFGKVALNLTFIETDAIPTTAVSARGLFFYNRRWVNHFDKVDAKWVLAHEVMHLVQRCFTRTPPGAHLRSWTMAADYVLECQLCETGLEQSKHSLYKLTANARALVEKYETVPGVYKQLLQDVKDNTECEACKESLGKLEKEGQQQRKSKQKENEEINKGNEGEESEGEGESNAEEDGEGEGEGHGGETPHTCGAEGIPCCSGNLPGMDSLDPTEQQEWLEKIIGAKLHAESKGNMPAGIGAEIDELVKSKVRWQDHLKAAASRLFGRDRYTYKRTNRRGPALGVRLPGHTPDGKTAIGAVDTSASMSADEVRQCVSEFAEIMRLCGCEKLWLILHDTCVYYSGWVDQADLTNLKMARGGTSHQEVFQCLNKKHLNKEFNLPTEEEVTLAILFTDLGTDFPDTSPNFEVIWGVPSDSCPGMATPVPFGKKVEVDMS